MIFLIGGNGLIGSAFSRYLKKNKISFKNLTRKNKKNFFNKKCDLIIDCNGNGSKRFGINNPLLDFKASVETVIENLCKIKFRKYIYISSCQVYENLSKKKFSKENYISRQKKINNYGFNKIIAENYIKKYSKKYMIIRLPYVIGPNLKRNPFYDLLYKKRSFLTLDSKINCIHTDSIVKICMELHKKNINGTFNIGSKNTIKINKIIKLLKLKKNHLKKNKRTKDINNINLDKIKKICNLPDIISETEKYFNNEKIKNFKSL